MPKHIAQLQDIDNSIRQNLLPFVDLSSKISVPYTTIQNRAQIPDLSKDLSSNFGINRIPVQSVYQLQNEFGPNGEPVYGVAGDVLGQIRMLGAGSDNATNGVSVIFDVAEVTFYGTGINILASIDNSGRDIRVTIDGGTESANVLPGTNTNGVLGARSYSSNQIVNVASGLALGIHTVRFRQAGPARVHGFEILNESSSLKVNQGSFISGAKKYELLAQQVLDPKAGFESGVLGTRGGHVHVYLKSDGTIGRAVTPTDATAAYLNSADHTNEELVRVYHWREFGVGRSDDFSTLLSSSSRAFTLDDGTTTLIGNSVTSDVLSGRSGFYLDTNNTSSMTFTFVGTGLDVVTETNGTGTESNQYPVYVDGVLQGYFNTASTTRKTYKICSGLPYGTHTVKISRLVPTVFSLAFTQFLTYAPKKPTVPVDAIEIADYYVMADFVANTTAGLETIATGVLRKHCTREFVYVGTGTFTLQNNVAYLGQYRLDLGGAGTVDYTMFGTGFELRGDANTGYSSTTVMKLNGVTVSTANFNINGVGTPTYGTIVVTTYGGFAFTASTGVLSLAASNAGASGIAVKGLALGKWTVQFANTTSDFLISAFDIITPIHSPKPNSITEIQNTYPIGSCSIGDLRSFITKPPQQKQEVFCRGVVNTPTIGGTSAWLPISDLMSVYKSKGEWVEISWSCQVTNTAFTALVPAVNGNVLMSDAPGADLSNSQVLSGHMQTYLPEGVHLIQMYWYSTGGSASLPQQRRYMTVKPV